MLSSTPTFYVLLIEKFRLEKNYNCLYQTYKIIEEEKTLLFTIFHLQFGSYGRKGVVENRCPFLKTDQYGRFSFFFTANIVGLRECNVIGYSNYKNEGIMCMCAVCHDWVPLQSLRARCSIRAYQKQRSLFTYKEALSLV